MWDLVKNSVTPISDRVINDQKNVHKEFNKKDCKDLFIIHHCVDPYNFKNIGHVDSSKEVWGIPEQHFVVMRR